MKRLFPWLLLAIALAAQGCGDSSSNPATPDAAARDLALAKDARGADAIVAPPTKLKVAAIQFGSSQYAQVNGCASVMCALTALATEAASKGAKIIVTPEYGFGQKTAEPSPEQGDKVAGDPRWPATTIIGAMAALAMKLDVTLVINVITQVGSAGSAKLYNTQLALSAEGKVLARHYKFQLFGNEPQQLTAGDSVTTNFFDTPAGKVGILICADIQCIVYGSGPDCPARNLKLLQQYAQQKAVVTLFSAYWTVGPTNAGSSAWWPLNVQKKYAVDTKSWVVAANTSSGAGQGGGIFAPDGNVLAKSETGKPAIIYADLPLKK